MSLGSPLFVKLDKSIVCMIAISSDACYEILVNVLHALYFRNKILFTLY